MLRTQKTGAGATKRKCHFEWNALKADGQSACTDTCSPRLLRSNLLSFGEIKEFQLSSAWKRCSFFFFFYVIYGGIAGNWWGGGSQNCLWGLNDQNLSFRNFASSFFFSYRCGLDLRELQIPSIRTSEEKMRSGTIVEELWGQACWNQRPESWYNFLFFFAGCLYHS